MTLASRTGALSALLVLLTLSAVDSAFATPAITITPTSGCPGTIVSVAGSGFDPASTTCAITSTPPGLISSSACTVSSGYVTGYFSVANGAIGAYTVKVTGTMGESASTVFTCIACAIASVVTATGTGTATFQTSDGVFTSLTAVDVASISDPAPQGVTFPHGLFSFTITGFTPGAMVTVTITLPAAVLTGTEYWKYQAPNWVEMPDTTTPPILGDNDGDNVLTLSITDGQLGDSDGLVDGTIVDPGGPGTRTGDYTIVVNTDPPGLDTPTGGGTYNLGDTAYISVGSLAMYTFGKWLRDGVDYTPHLTDMSFSYTVDGSHNFTATFAPLPLHCISAACRVNFYTVPATIGSITFQGVQYTNGMSSPLNVVEGDYPVAANPPSGYAFTSWSTAGVTINPTNTQVATLHVETSGNLTAIFNQTSAEICKVVVNTSPSGLDNPIAKNTTVTYPGGGTFPTNSPITISVDNVADYYFQLWQKDTVNYNWQQTFQYSCVGQHTFTAVFSRSPPAQEIDVTVNTNPQGLDNPHGGGTYAQGTPITISVSNVAGYTFHKWQRDGADYTPHLTDMSFSYTVDAPHVFTAVFTQAAPSPPPSPVPGFPIESILAGLVAGVAVLAVLRHQPRRRS